MSKEKTESTNIKLSFIIVGEEYTGKHTFVDKLLRLNDEEFRNDLYMKKFEKEAKGYGIMYYPIPNSNRGDGMYDIMVKEEDAPRINRLVERLKLASVSEAAKVKTEIEKSRKEKTVPEKTQPEKSADDKLVDELLSGPIKKEEKSLSNPSVAKTEKSHLSEPTSKKPKRAAEGTSKDGQIRVGRKPSVRKELQDIKAARKQEAERTKERTKKGPEPKKRVKRPKER